MSKPILRKPMFPNNGEQTTAVFGQDGDNFGCDHHAETGWSSWFTKRRNGCIGIEISVSAHPHVVLLIDSDEGVMDTTEIRMHREQAAEFIAELESALRFAHAIADNNQYAGDDA